MTQGLLPRTGYWTALLVTSFLAVTPFLLGAPEIGPYLLLLVPMIVTIILHKAYRSPGVRTRILVFTTVGTALTLGTGLIIRNLPPFDVFGIPTPNIIAPAFHLDGEEAYDAGMYELWCEIWLALGFLVAFAWGGIRAVAVFFRQRRAH